MNINLTNLEVAAAVTVIGGKWNPLPEPMCEWGEKHQTGFAGRK
ncbi:MAG TPA: hypothetical protein VEL06_12975 [Haliangiales bacterium]|nr:hypothetical protein [Haliangiales bacterium]